MPDQQARLNRTSLDFEEQESSQYFSSGESISKSYEEQTNKREGKWTEEEHALFVQGLRLYGKKWTKISALVKTRNNDAIRSHAQKFF